MADILIVDDSVSMRQMVTYSLENAGYNVSEAADGVEGLKEAKNKDYKLVITDVNMPSMDGVELTQELRKLPGYKFTPILFLTTESDADIKLKGRQAGATGWLVKPFDPDQLINTVAHVLE